MLTEKQHQTTPDDFSESNCCSSSERLLRLLSELGYERADSLSVEHLQWAFDSDNKGVAKFLDWVALNVSAEKNALSKDELDRKGSLEKIGIFPTESEVRAHYGKDVDIAPMPYIPSELRDKLNQVQNSRPALDAHVAIISRQKEKLLKSLKCLENEELILKKAEEWLNEQSRRVDIALGNDSLKMDAATESAVGGSRSLIQNAVEEKTRYIYQCDDAISELELADDAFRQAVDQFCRKEFQVNERSEDVSEEDGCSSVIQSLSAELQRLKTAYFDTEKQHVQAAMELLQEQTYLKELERLGEDLNFGSDEAKEIYDSQSDILDAPFTSLHDSIESELTSVLAQLAEYDVRIPPLTSDYKTKTACSFRASQKLDQLILHLLEHKSLRDVLSAVCDYEEEKLFHAHSLLEAYKSDVEERLLDRQARIEAMSRPPFTLPPPLPTVDRQHDKYYNFVSQIIGDETGFASSKNAESTSKVVRAQFVTHESLNQDAGTLAGDRRDSIADAESAESNVLDLIESMIKAERIMKYTLCNDPPIVQGELASGIPTLLCDAQAELCNVANKLQPRLRDAVKSVNEADNASPKQQLVSKFCNPEEFVKAYKHLHKVDER